MITRPIDPREMSRLSQELARDPRSLAFVPLARAYADRGQLDAALRLCVQGLGHHPEHVEAHCLLGRVYHARGELDKAYDELEIALHLDPGHATARGELALLARERSEKAAAAAKAADTARAASLDVAIGRFVAAVRPEAVLLLSSSGKLLGQHGVAAAVDAIGVASLAAGIQAASARLADLLREDGFDHLYQDGNTRQVFLGCIATPTDRLVVVVITRDKSRLGLLRIGFRAMVHEIGALPEWRLRKQAVSADAFEEDLHSGWAEVFGGAGRIGAAIPVSGP